MLRDTVKNSTVFFFTFPFSVVQFYLFITVLDPWNLAPSGLAALGPVSRYGVSAVLIFLTLHRACPIKKFLIVLCMTWDILCLNSSLVDSKIFWGQRLFFFYMIRLITNFRKWSFSCWFMAACSIRSCAIQQCTNKRCFSPTSCLLACQGRDWHLLKDCVLSPVTIVCCTCKKESTDLHNFSELL